MYMVKRLPRSEVRRRAKAIAKAKRKKLTKKEIFQMVLVIAIIAGIILIALALGGVL